jgi:hypothetical protein
MPLSILKQSRAIESTHERVTTEPKRACSQCESMLRALRTTRSRRAVLPQLAATNEERWRDRAELLSLSLSLSFSLSLDGDNMKTAENTSRSRVVERTTRSVRQRRRVLMNWRAFSIDHGVVFAQ